MTPMAGRFAPSPTGDLHLGNLRTALAAWFVARSRRAAFVLRMEDLDRATSSPAHESAQQRDLAALGIDWDGDVVRQSERFDRYHAAIDELTARGLTYPCFCSRREIREAAAAPHGAPLVYPGTCRGLSDTTRRTRAAERPAALRFRAAADPIVFADGVAGRQVGRADDVVLRRNDGVPAYNIAVVVDDAAQGVDHVVRADDLLASTPGQIALHRALGLPEPDYVHVPLVVGRSGERLAKRDGAVTLTELAAVGVGVDAVRGALAASLGAVPPGAPVPADGLVSLAETFSPVALRSVGRSPVTLQRLAELGLGNVRQG